MVLAELDHSVDFVSCFGGWSHAVYPFVVGVIHDNNTVEAIEIVGCDLSGAAGEVISTSRGGFSHAGIGGFAGVTAVGAGRIDHPNRSQNARVVLRDRPVVA